MTLNLSQVFVRYPDPAGAAGAVRDWLAARAKAGVGAPEHVVAAAGGGWIAILTRGNDASSELAEHLSRGLEAEAVWFGLAGRALAYRLRAYRHGRRTEEIQEPAEFFGVPEPFPLPAYPDAEQALFDRLGHKGLPQRYLFLHCEEMGVEAREGVVDAFAVRPVGEGRIEEGGFVHRLPRRDPSRPRTLFDRFDDEKKVVADEVVLRGTFDEGRGVALLAQFEAMARRRAVPAGWRYVYILHGAPDLLRPIGELFSRAKRGGYELTVA